MSKSKIISAEFEVVDNLQDLSEAEQDLCRKAKDAAMKAYAPYSKFKVGAAVCLSDGTVVLASNKENASFPAGICAERNALNQVSDQYPDAKVVSIALYAETSEFSIVDPLAPCGICRQVLCEFEKNQETPIRIIMLSSSGGAMIAANAASLLPFHFYPEKLKK